MVCLIFFFFYLLLFTIAFCTTRQHCVDISRVFQYLNLKCLGFFFGFTVRSRLTTSCTYARFAQVIRDSQPSTEKYVCTRRQHLFLMRIYIVNESIMYSGLDFDIEKSKIWNALPCLFNRLHIFQIFNVNVVKNIAITTTYDMF